MKAEERLAKNPDFLAEQLPSSRRRQFFDILKNEWRTLLFLGAVLCLFYLPFLISHIAEAGFMNGSAEAMRAELMAQGKSEEEIASSVKAQMSSIHLLFNGVNILCFMVFSFGLAGASRVIKCLCFGEGVLLKSDFIAGIKKYWKSFLLVGFFAGLFFFLVSYVSASLRSFSSGMSVLSGLTTGFFYALIVPILLFSLSQATLYGLPFFHSLANSVRFTLIRYHWTLLFALFVYGLSLIALIVYPLFMILAYLGAVLLLLPVFELAFHLYSLSLFDLYINEGNYPSIYRKGLYTKEGKAP